MVPEGSPPPQGDVSTFVLRLVEPEVVISFLRTFRDPAQSSSDRISSFFSSRAELRPLMTAAVAMRNG